LMAREYDVDHVYADAEELLQSGNIDAVLVCTPHPSHGPLVVAAADAGVHVMCEKPMTISLAEADSMIDAARKANIKFGVIFQRRFWPAAQRIRNAIDQRKLGNLTLGECTVRISRTREYFGADPWRGTWANEGGGVLMNQAVHAIDQFQWFMGEPVEVFGRYATLRHGDYIDVEDTAVATVKFDNGALGVIEASSTFSTSYGFRIAVHGDSGAAVSVWEKPEGRQGINDIWDIPGEDHLQIVWAEQERDGEGFPEFHVLQIQDFLQAVRDDRDPAVTGEEARKSLEIILAIYHSNRTGLPVSLPLAAESLEEPAPIAGNAGSDE
jgi:UDP-N-acetyl-2-amino-2-deoxyglucuronate dehydrogenase